MSGLGARDIGHRVVVRHRIPGGLTDLIGVLQAGDPQILAVRHADGTVHEIPTADVTAAKTIPEMPLRPVDVDQLFLTAALGRPAAETAYVGHWLLRASAGWTGRGNSLLPAGDPGMPVPDALQQAIGFYTERNLPAQAQIRLGSPQDEQIRACGWVDARPEQSDVLVMHTTLDHVNATPAYDVQVADRPNDAWYAAAFDSPVPVVAPQVLEGAAKAVFASVSLDGQVVAVGRGSMTGHWLGVDAIRVCSGYRRRGLGTAIVQGLARWAGPHGGRRTYLEVLLENAAAMATYTRLGYREAYRYRYLTSR
ncbi:GNAT family N-acetyltransferase [Kribbella jiaozuonensis]|uniref:GNAT family N-acetyltransferase n=1 Tax=Kribbella jiaozuonensis TaxID=2575441 RepID=A0A4U3LJ91_9ACTN|nr:GNAT family N-acetyltransferase [Kribbella jiaozuonensis]TKK75472.1 GNAT family N-acetyltransferase [Kribbella jiaozuonensis]